MNFFNDKEQEKILDFKANSGLNIANRDTPTRITNTNYTLIDYCFMSNDQIKDYTITDPPFHSDHMLSIFETNIRPEQRQNEDVYIRSKKHFSRSKFNRDLALTKWWEMYKETDSDSMFSKFLELFETVLNEHAPIKPI